MDFQFRYGFLRSGRRQTFESGREATPLVN